MHSSNNIVELKSFETAVPPQYTPDLSTTVGKLKHLRHVVERIDPARFAMGTLIDDTECGTVGCMLGWAAMDPHFNAIGLTTEVGPKGRRVCTPSRKMWWDASFGNVAEEIFEIGIRDADDLFSVPDHFRSFTIAHGLARIDKMISKYTAATP